MDREKPFRGQAPLSAPLLLALAFALIGMIGAAVAAVSMPPLQAADEPFHMMRAWEIAHGGFVSARLSTVVAGGRVDPAIPALQVSVGDWLQAPAGSPDLPPPGVLAAASAVRWTHQPVRIDFPSTAIYPPLFYLPAAAAIRAGGAMNLPVVPTLILARLAQGIATVGLGSLAIALAGATAPWLFVLLTLPMTLSLAGACSPDGPMIAATALAAGLLARLSAGGLENPGGRHGLATLALAATVMQRPPYLFLALTLLLPGSVSRRRRWISLGLVVACALGWAAFAEIHIAVPFGLPGASLPDQAAGLLAAPWRFVPILIRTYVLWAGYLLTSAIGVLGGMNMPLSQGYYAAAEAMLALAAVLTARGAAGPGLPQLPPGPARRSVALGLAAIGLSFVALAGALYLTWTPVGLDLAAGLQGRYFLPIAAFVPLLFPGLGRRDGRGFPAPLRAATLALPIAFTLPTLIAMLDAIAARY
jgi:hypothetical protein